MIDPKILEDQIRQLHRDDPEQLQAIFANSPRILVEAPAGYGKTRTMISRIAFLLAANRVPYPKKMLAVTFSVNAAYKIRKDVAEQIPKLLAINSRDFRLRTKVLATNYHGFARGVLRKHGKYFDDSLSRFDELKTFDDGNADQLKEFVPALRNRERDELIGFATAVREQKVATIKANLDRYCEILWNEVTTAGCISYNGILALTLQLFTKRPDIAQFYQALYPHLIVDEFQDSNWLSLGLVTKLVGERSEVMLLGDSLQRIYGFIGAVPESLGKAEAKFQLEKITLIKNYRFAANPQMLALDANIRANAANPSSPIINEDANLEFKLAEDQPHEARLVRERVVSIIEASRDSKVAILFSQRGPNLEAIRRELTASGIDHFYGLFSDDDVTYSRFHRESLDQFLQLTMSSTRLRKSVAEIHLQRLREVYDDSVDPTVESCLLLLEAFWSRLWVDGRHLSDDDKKDFAQDVFHSNGLKQWVEFLSIPVVLSTVHAAKGLEWDFVILPDMEQDSFPRFFALCRSCIHRRACQLTVSEENQNAFLEELSLFYVGVTRARQQVFFTSSKLAANGQTRNISCLLFLPGLVIEAIE